MGELFWEENSSFYQLCKEACDPCKQTPCLLFLMFQQVHPLIYDSHCHSDATDSGISNLGLFPKPTRVLEVLLEQGRWQDLSLLLLVFPPERLSGLWVGQGVESLNRSSSAPIQLQVHTEALHHPAISPVSSCSRKSLLQSSSCAQLQSCLEEILHSSLLSEPSLSGVTKPHIHC